MAGMLCRICTCALYPLPKMGICAFALSELGKCGIASRALASTRFCNHARPQGLPVTPGKSIPQPQSSNTQTVHLNPTITVEAPNHQERDANLAQQTAAFFAQAGKDFTTYVQSEIAQSQTLLSAQIQAMNQTIADMKDTALKHFEVQKATYAQHFNDPGGNAG